MQLPQSNSLQEIQRACLYLETLIMRRMGKGSFTDKTISGSRGGIVTAPAALETPSPDPGGGGGSVAGPWYGISVQTPWLQAITLDPVDGLPETDSEDCAIVEVQPVPMLTKPMVPVVLSAAASGGTQIYGIPYGFNELDSYVSVDGHHYAALRVEVLLGAKRIVFYNNSIETEANAWITVALQGADPADPGISIAPGHLAWLQEKGDASGLEWVFYYE
jgi:hypothetical protein